MRTSKATSMEDGTEKASAPVAETQSRTQPWIKEGFAGLSWGAIGILCGHVWIWEVAHRTGELFGPLNQSIILYLALSVFMLLMAAVAIGARPRARRFAMLDWPFAAVMIVGTLLLCLPVDIVGVTVEMRMLIGSILGGVGIGWTYLQWSFFYASLSTRSIVACIFGAMAVGSAIKIAIDLIPALPCCIVCALLCFLSPVLLRLAFNANTPNAGSGNSDEAFGYESSNKEAMRAAVAAGRPIAKLFAGVVAYGLVIGIIQGMSVQAAYTPKVLLTFVHHGLEVIAAIIVLWYVLGSRRHGLRFSIIWRVVLIATGAGVMLLPLVGPVFAGWALVAVAVAQTLVVMLLWAMLADVARMQRNVVCPIAIFGVGWTVYSLTFPIGYFLAQTLEAGGGANPWIGLIVYILALATVFLLDERDFSTNRVFADLEEKPLPPSMDDMVRKASAKIGAQAGLTDREIEVMRLIALGRSKGYIAETLCISENTVRSHSRHLYTKLNVHSKQELLDLMQQEVAHGSNE